MMVRKVDFGVNEVSSMLMTRDESILLSMISLAIMLKSTSSDDFITAFRAFLMLRIVCGTSTKWRPRKSEYHLDVSCVDGLAPRVPLQRVVDHGGALRDLYAGKR